MAEESELPDLWEEPYGGPWRTSVARLRAVLAAPETAASGAPHPS